MQIIQTIQNKIYEIRGERVMLDKDLAALYETETKRLIEAVKRNIKRFPKDFMFQLTAAEFESLRSQFATSNNSLKPLRLQVETSNDDSLRLQSANLRQWQRAALKISPLCFHRTRCCHVKWNIKF
jgi:hypothetical protein